MSRRIREGSIADKFVKTCDWLDNSKPGMAIGMAVVGLMFAGLAVYGLNCTHPFI